MPIKSITFKMGDKLKAAQGNERKIVHARVAMSIRNSCIAAMREIKKNIVPGWNMGHKTRNPHFTGSSGLSGSITFDESQIARLKGIVGAHKDYDAIQEYGGEIRPVRAKSLFIPMSTLGRKVGPTPGGNPILKYGRDFIFKQVVYIKPKRYFERGIDSAMPAMIQYLKDAGVEVAGDFGFE